MSTYPENASAVNDGSAPQPAYYAVIPASVRYCKALPPNAKLLYGELTALCAKEGYAWATNSYFVALYDVDDRTIRRWLAALVQHGFIKVFVVGPKRRIYLAETAPKVAKSRAKMSGLGGQKCPGKPDKNVRHSITSKKTNINTSEDARERSRFVGPGPVPARQLKEQEKQDAASPEPLIFKSNENLRIQRVERVVAKIGNHSFRAVLGELWDTVERNGCVDLWQDGLDAVKSVESGSAGLPGGLGAYFCSVVAAGLAGRGIAVPLGAGASASVAACGSGAEPQPPQSANGV